LFQKDSPPRIKPLLYVYRVILTGIHLMRSGKIEANLVTLNKEFRLPYILELVERKVLGSEAGRLDTDERSFHQTEYARLMLELKAAAAESKLPEEPTCRGRSTTFSCECACRALSPNNF
jgi:predicted nucleotidyltransferase